MTRTDHLPAESISPDHVPTPRADLAVAELAGETVLGDPQTGRVHHLDPIGSAVWSLLDGRRSVRALAAELAAAYRAERAVVEADVLALLRRLGGQGLLAGVAPSHEGTAGGAAQPHGHDHRNDATPPEGAGPPAPRYLAVAPST
ncbi:MAG: PqqD family protein [Actinomycetota bacterium]|nr:PqqD family protein [Actinomycetota bacterium]